VTLSLDVIGDIKSAGQIRAWERVSYDVESFGDYKNIPKSFKHFFRCSVLKKWECFDFETAFKVTLPFIKRKLHDHRIYSYRSYYNSCWAKCCPEFLSLLNILDAYSRLDKWDVMGRVMLFDSIIHAEHMEGDIFEYELLPEDPDSLRLKVEKELW